MQSYYFPAEDEQHEGTWHTWPHHYTYGMKYRNEIEPIWIQMVVALHPKERIHIVAYNKKERSRIDKLLTKEGVDMGKVDFVISKSDDVWIRDTGPIFVRDAKGKVFIADFKFDGWGKKVSYRYDDAIPKNVAKATGIPILTSIDLILEGGSLELDGKGTVMLCKSSLISRNRNSKMHVEEVKEYLTRYLGVKNFILLEGVLDEEITDAHIDGIARFYDDQTLLTVSEADFFSLYEGIQERDYDTLHRAVNAKGKPYTIVELPMTAKNVQGLSYKGSYLNYYVGNEVVLVPVYNDVNDKLAIDILKKVYVNKEMVPIDVSALYPYGGMLHCVTQQQPQSK